MFVFCLVVIWLCYIDLCWVLTEIIVKTKAFAPEVYNNIEIWTIYTKCIQHNWKYYKQIWNIKQHTLTTFHNSENAKWRGPGTLVRAVQAIFRNLLFLLFVFFPMVFIVNTKNTKWPEPGTLVRAVQAIIQKSSMFNILLHFRCFSQYLIILYVIFNGFAYIDCYLIVITLICNGCRQKYTELSNIL